MRKVGWYFLVIQTTLIAICRYFFPFNCAHDPSQPGVVVESQVFHCGFKQLLIQSWNIKRGNDELFLLNLIVCIVILSHVISDDAVYNVLHSEIIYFRSVQNRWRYRFFSIHQRTIQWTTQKKKASLFKIIHWFWKVIAAFNFQHFLTFSNIYYISNIC